MSEIKCIDIYSSLEKGRRHYFYIAVEYECFAVFACKVET